MFCHQLISTRCVFTSILAIIPILIQQVSSCTVGASGVEGLYVDEFGWENWKAAVILSTSSSSEYGPYRLDWANSTLSKMCQTLLVSNSGGASTSTTDTSTAANNLAAILNGNANATTAVPTSLRGLRHLQPATGNIRNCYKQAWEVRRWPSGTVADQSQGQPDFCGTSAKTKEDEKKKKNKGDTISSDEVQMYIIIFSAIFVGVVLAIFITWKLTMRMADDAARDPAEKEREKAIDPKKLAKGEDITGGALEEIMDVATRSHATRKALREQQMKDGTFGMGGGIGGGGVASMSMSRKMSSRYVAPEVGGDDDNRSIIGRRASGTNLPVDIDIRTGGVVNMSRSLGAGGGGPGRSNSKNTATSSRTASKESKLSKNTANSTKISHGNANGGDSSDESYFDAASGRPSKTPSKENIQGVIKRASISGVTQDMNDVVARRPSITQRGIVASGASQQLQRNVSKDNDIEEAFQRSAQLNRSTNLVTGARSSLLGRRMSFNASQTDLGAIMNQSQGVQKQTSRTPSRTPRRDSSKRDSITIDSRSPRDEGQAPIERSLSRNSAYSGKNLDRALQKQEEQLVMWKQKSENARRASGSGGGHIPLPQSSKQMLLGGAHETHVGRAQQQAQQQSGMGMMVGSLNLKNASMRQQQQRDMANGNTPITSSRSIRFGVEKRLTYNDLAAAEQTTVIKKRTSEESSGFADVSPTFGRKPSVADSLTDEIIE